MHHVSSRLATRAGIRQVEAVLKAEAAANAVDRAVGSVWRNILALLARKPDAFTAHHEALTIAHELHPATIGATADSLKRIAHWGHRTARRDLIHSLPLDYLQRAAVTESVLTEDLPAPQPGAIELILNQFGLHPNDLLAPLREPVSRGLSDQQKRELFGQLIFPPPSETKVKQIIYGTSGGVDWVTRLTSATRLATPQQIANILTAGTVAGKTQREIAKDLLPVVDNVRTTARRIARTEGMRVAGATQQEMHEQLGDLVVGYQIHATLDAYTRPWHAARHGTIYYLEPKADQKGPLQQPHPPEEAQDASERPAGTPHVAWNCRCYMSPVLRPPAWVKDQDRVNIFTNAADKVIPDPLAYRDWFAKADEKRRRIAVGTRKYTAVRDKVGGHPEWEDFLDPDTGELLPLQTLKAETHADRNERMQKVLALLMDRRKHLAQVELFGFEHEPELPVVIGNQPGFRGQVLGPLVGGS